MSKVTISALGVLSNKIKEETSVELPEGDFNAFWLVEQFDIAKNESRMAFNINGRMESGSYILKPNDVVVVLKMGGAG